MNGVVSEWRCNPFWSRSIHSERGIASVIVDAALTLTLGVNGPLVDFVVVSEFCMFIFVLTEDRLQIVVGSRLLQYYPDFPKKKTTQMEETKENLVLAASGPSSFYLHKFD